MMIGGGGEATPGEDSKTNIEPTPANHNTNDNDDKGSDSDGDAAEEILEESPDKRWSKRREKVKQRDVPGIDAAFLAMDNETGNEVVWNEVLFSERKNFREQEKNFKEKIKAVFDNLTHLVHVNLVKFHKYWTDTKSEKPRIIFITEYMSSGSMSRFLQRTRASGTLLNIRAWKKWATQILSALNYLHKCDPPIVHANLTCNTVFIQQNGLIKIGCVAPNAIHHHVKTFRECFKNMHYVAPEQERVTQATTQADIYSFGICALEMAMTGALIGGSSGAAASAATCNGGASDATPATVSSYDAIRKSLDAIEDPLQRDFIEKCLNPDPDKRPTARELLFHPVLFEVHSLKLIAAHAIVNTKLTDQLNEDDLRVRDRSRVAVESAHKRLTYAELPCGQVDLEKFLEDVKNGIYPLIAFAPWAHLPTTKLHSSPSLSAISSAILDPSGQTSQHSGGPVGGSAIDDYYYRSSDGRDSIHSSPEPTAAAQQHHQQQQSSQQYNANKNGYNQPAGGVGGVSSTLGVSTTTVAGGGVGSAVTDDEGYHTAPNLVGAGSAPPQSAQAAVERQHETRMIRQMQASIDGTSLQVLLRLDDQMNRQLTTEITAEDTSEKLVVELVQFGFISELDSTKMCALIESALNDTRLKAQPSAYVPSRQTSPA